MFPAIWHTSLLPAENCDERFHMVLQSSKKCKNYKQQSSHSPEKYQGTEITMLHCDVSSMKSVSQRKVLGNAYETYLSLSAKIRVKTF